MGEYSHPLPFAPVPSKASPKGSFGESSAQCPPKFRFPEPQEESPYIISPLLFAQSPSLIPSSPIPPSRQPFPSPYPPYLVPSVPPPPLPPPFMTGVNFLPAVHYDPFDGFPPYSIPTSIPFVPPPAPHISLPPPFPPPPPPLPPPSMLASPLSPTAPIPLQQPMEPEPVGSAFQHSYFRRKRVILNVLTLVISGLGLALGVSLLQLFASLSITNSPWNQISLSRQIRASITFKYLKCLTSKELNDSFFSFPFLVFTVLCGLTFLLCVLFLLSDLLFKQRKAPRKERLSLELVLNFCSFVLFLSTSLALLFPQISLNSNLLYHEIDLKHAACNVYGALTSSTTPPPSVSSPSSSAPFGPFDRRQSQLFCFGSWVENGIAFVGLFFSILGCITSLVLLIQKKKLLKDYRIRNRPSKTPPIL